MVRDGPAPSFLHEVRRLKMQPPVCEICATNRCGSPPRPRSPSLPPARRPGRSTLLPHLRQQWLRRPALCGDAGRGGGTHRLSGRAVLTVKAEAELAKFALDLSGLEVTRVRDERGSSALRSGAGQAAGQAGQAIRARAASFPSRSPIAGAEDHRDPTVDPPPPIPSSAGPTGQDVLLRRQRAGRRRHLVSGQ